jgi:hypothetical protein
MRDDDPLNKPPPDEAWGQRADELAEAAAKELDSMVVLVAIRAGGNLGISVGGEELPGPVLDNFRSIKREHGMPHFLGMLSHAAALHELRMEGKQFKVEIAPGAFDNFEGTPEELQEVLAEAHRMFESGEFLEHGRPVTDEEAEELAQRPKPHTRQ